MINRPFTKFWEGFVEPVSSGNTRERHLSRTLNIILLLLLLWGIGFEIQHRIEQQNPQHNGWNCINHPGDFGTGLFLSTARDNFASLQF